MASIKPPQLPADLPTTLAQRVQMLRELRGWSSAKLAELAAVPFDTLQDVEGGLMTFLPEVTRRRLARALRIPTGWLKAVEHIPEGARLELDEATSRPPKPLSLEETACPECGADVHRREFDREDPDGARYVLVRHRCSRCLYERSVEMSY